MKIAVIDSGVNATLFPNINIKQFRFYNNEVIEEEPKDYLGHGTAVISCIFTRFPECEFLSLCPGIDESGTTDYIIEAYDIANAIRFAVDAGMEIINISMGTTDFSNRECIDAAVKYAYEKNAIIVASAPNETKPSLPWACSGAVKVRETKGNGYHVSIQKDCFGVMNFFIECQLFRVLTKEGKRIFAHGNSYSTVWITLLLMKLKLQYEQENIVELCTRLGDDFTQEEVRDTILRKFDVVERMEELENQSYQNKRLILYSWTKEMHSIVRGSKIHGYQIVGAVDYFKKGHIGRDIGLLSNDGEYGVKISSDLGEITEEADVLVIGYLDQICDKDQKFTQEYILEYNLQHKKLDVFSFSPVTQEWKDRYKEVSVSLSTPYVFNYESCEQLFRHVHSFVPIKKPVLGVFGTSSKQGKFTLQVKLRERLNQRNISCYHLSTEHQATILGADLTFADGYENNRIMEIDTVTKIRVLKSIMTYIDNRSKDDFIMVGGQSWLIPYNIKEQTFIRYAVFLEATQPDCSIVVFNPLLDVEEYVKDTLAVLKSLYKCKTIAVAFSDYTPYVRNGKIKHKSLEEQEKQEISKKWSEILGLPCGCITDSNYMDQLVDCIEEQFN